MTDQAASAVISASPRDTSVITSSRFSGVGINRMLIAAVNTTEASYSSQPQGSFDGTLWFNVGSAIVTADGHVTPTKTLATVITDPWPFFRVVSTPTGTPTVGTFKVYQSHN